jgi:hypothetical protein
VSWDTAVAFPESNSGRFTAPHLRFKKHLEFSAVVALLSKLVNIAQTLDEPHPPMSFKIARRASRAAALARWSQAFSGSPSLTRLCQFPQNANHGGASAIWSSFRARLSIGKMSSPSCGVSQSPAASASPCGPVLMCCSNDPAEMSSVDSRGVARAQSPAPSEIEREEIVISDFNTSGYILDLGGGCLSTIGRLKGEQVVAIDISMKELNEAPSGFLKILMDASELKFPDKSFRTVTAFFSLMFMKPEIHRRVFALSRPRAGGRMVDLGRVDSRSCGRARQDVPDKSSQPDSPKKRSTMAILSSGWKWRGTAVIIAH